MGQRSGVGLVEIAILQALDARRAWPGRRAASCSKVLAALEDELGLARGYAYQVLIDLAPDGLALEPPACRMRSGLLTTCQLTGSCRGVARKRRDASCPKSGMPATVTPVRRRKRRLWLQ